MKRRSFSQSDQIRLELEWLDQYATDKPPALDRVFSRAPIIPLASSLIVGIGVYESLPSKVAVWTASAACIFALILSFIAVKAENKNRLILVFVSACIMFFSLGTLRSANVQYRPPNHISRLVSSERVLATVQGTVVSPVFVNRPESIPWLGDQSSFYLDAEQVHTASGWRQTCGKIRVQVSDTLNSVQCGNRIQVYCRLSTFQPPANDGQTDIRTILKRRGVTVSATVNAVESIEIIDSDVRLLSTIRDLLSRQASEVLLDETMSDTDVRSLTAALVLGKRGDLNPQVTAAFRNSGLTHHISLSGTHVGILAGSLWVLLRMTGLNKRKRAALCILIVVLYAMMVPPRAPTLRAVFLCCFFFLSIIITKNTSSLNTLSLSAIVLLLMRPWDLFNAGWQLSFSCVLGIILFYKIIFYHLLSKLFYPLLSLMDWRFAWLHRIGYWFLQLLAVGIAAWVAGAPVMLVHFGTVNPLAPLWAVVTLPFVLIILYGGFAKLIIGPVLPTLGAILGLIVNFAARAFEWVVIRLAAIDCFTISVPHISLLLIVTFCVLVIVLRHLPFYHYRLKKPVMGLLALCIIGAILLPGYTRWKRPELELTCLSVGHGQAVILSTPAGRHALFDAGSITHQDVASKILEPYCRDRGIRTFDAVFLSHGDMDHINAVADTAAGMQVSHVYANPELLKTARRPSIEKELVSQLDIMGLTTETVPHQVQFADVCIRSLWPDEAVSHDPAISENDKSQVILIEYAGRRILLCGDLQSDGQRRFLKAWPGLDVDVMMLPHHGSTTNLDDKFIERLQPETVIASGSQRNARNAYRPDQPDIKAFYTATDGAVTIKIKADGAISTIGFLESQ